MLVQVIMRMMMQAIGDGGVTKKEVTELWVQSWQPDVANQIRMFSSSDASILLSDQPSFALDTDHPWTRYSYTHIWQVWPQKPAFKILLAITQHATSFFATVHSIQIGHLAPWNPSDQSEEHILGP